MLNKTSQSESECIENPIVYTVSKQILKLCIIYMQASIICCGLNFIFFSLGLNFNTILTHCSRTEFLTHHCDISEYMMDELSSVQKIKDNNCLHFRILFCCK